MTAMFEKLVAVRSQLAESLLEYLQNVESALARNPLLDRFGRSLDDVRVPLRAVPFEPVRHTEEAAQTEHLRTPAATRDDDDEPGRKRYAFRPGARDEREPVRQPPRPLNEIEPLLQHAVLLADPGGGKTEWLKDLLRRQAIRSKDDLKNRTVTPDKIVIPVFLRLPEVAKALGHSDENERDDALRDFLMQRGCIASSAVLGDAQRIAAAMLMKLVERRHLPERLAPFLWEKWFPAQPDARATDLTRRPLVCLDAWDETRKRRERLACCLNAFAAESACRIFLTSRIVGYSHHPLPVESVAEGPQRELRICPYEWNDTEKFVGDWFRADPERGAQMVGELRNKISVFGMAQNPLMATLLCLAYSPSARREPLPFPLRRGAVYERVLWGLLGEWPRRREGEVQKEWKLSPEERKRCEAKLDLLAELAHHFFLQGAERFSRTALEEAMRGYLSSKRGKPLFVKEAMRLLGSLTKEQKKLYASLAVDEKRDWERENVVTLLNQELIEQDGLLALDIEDEDESYYGFLHLTFQEYLTACALGRRANDHGWHTIEALVSKKAWAFEWEEVIILLAGNLNHPMRQLEMLSNPLPTPINPHGDDLFRHRLVLAALCLPEIQSPARNSQSLIIDQITSDAISLLWKSGINFHDEAFMHLRRTLPALGQVNGRIDGDRPLLDWLGRQLLIKGETRRRLAIDIVGNMGNIAAVPIILTRLVMSLRDKSTYLRDSAARAIEKLGSAAATPAILDCLTKMLEDEDRNLRKSAIMAIGSLGSIAATPPILDHLAKMLSHSIDGEWDIAAESFRKLGPVATTPVVLSLLTKHFTQTRDLYIEAHEHYGGDNYKDRPYDNPDFPWLPALSEFYESIERLAKLGSIVVTPAILDRLTELLGNDWKLVRMSAARALGRRGNVPNMPAILSCLVESLHDESWFVRFLAAETIGLLGAVTAIPAILSQLTNLLYDEDEDVRSAAANTLSKLGSSVVTLAALDRLADLLHDDEALVRHSAVESIGNLGTAAVSYGVLNSLVELLHDENWDVRIAAANILGRFGSSVMTPAILNCLAELLRDDNDDVYESSVQAIGNLSSILAAPYIITYLSELLHDENDLVRCKAAYTIEKLGIPAVTPAVIDILVKLLRDESWTVRSATAGIIGRLGSFAATPAVLDRLSEMICDENDMKSELLTAIGRLGFTAATPIILDRFAGLLCEESILERSSAALGLKEMMAQGVRIFERSKGKWEAKTVEELSQFVESQ